MINQYQKLDNRRDVWHPPESKRSGGGSLVSAGIKDWKKRKHDRFSFYSPS